MLDVLALLELIRSYKFIDKQNVFLAGQSRGGMMTYLAIKHGAKVNAAIVMCGLTDLVDLDKVNNAKTIVKETIGTSNFEKALKDRLHFFVSLQKEWKHIIAEITHSTCDRAI